jgi:hypothetical protein
MSTLDPRGNLSGTGASASIAGTGRGEGPGPDEMAAATLDRNEVVPSNRENVEYAKCRRSDGCDVYFEGRQYYESAARDGRRPISPKRRAHQTPPLRQPSNPNCASPCPQERAGPSAHALDIGSS